MPAWFSVFVVYFKTPKIWSHFDCILDSCSFAWKYVDLKVENIVLYLVHHRPALDSEWEVWDHKVVLDKLWLMKADRQFLIKWPRIDEERYSGDITNTQQQRLTRVHSTFSHISTPSGLLSPSPPADLKE